MNRYLVIGGTGFIGAAVVRDLVAHNKKVILCARSCDESRSTSVGSSVTLAQGSWTSLEFLRDTFERYSPTHVVHLANAGLPVDSNRNPRLDLECNLLPFIDLLNLCVECKLEKIVFASSGGAIYGRTSVDHISESHSTHPISSYGITKLVIEKYMQMYFHLYKLKYTALRISNPYGPGQNPIASQGAIAVFMHKVLTDLPITLWGDGSNVRDYVFIDDVATAFRSALEEDAVGSYNIGSGVGKSLIEIIRIIEQVTGNTSRVRYERGRAADVNRVVLDTRQAKDALGWSSSTSLCNGLKMTKSWLVQ